MQWQYRILELFDVMLNQFEFPDGFRAAAALRGFHFGHTRLPQTSEQRSEHKVLSNVMQCILADFELVNPPAAGCPVRTGDIGMDKMEQIVYKVVHEIKNRGLF
jgi:4-hydroxy-tetrahydrodipicolinate synthase